MIGTFDKRAIIAISGNVMKEIVQEGVGEMMSGALIARTKSPAKIQKQHSYKATLSP